MLLRAFLLSTVFMAHSGPFQESAHEHLYDADSYDVYSAVLNEGLFVNDRESHRILISEMTESETSWDAACPSKVAKRDSAAHQAVVAYAVASQRSYLLHSNFALRKPYKLLTQREVDTFYDALFKKDQLAGWKRLYELNPGVRGIYGFSVVGFSNDKTVAIVHVSFVCDYLCGETGRFLVRKIDGKWKSVTDLGCRGVSAQW